MPTSRSSRQSPRPHPHPGRIIVGVLLDLACKACAALVLASVGVMIWHSGSLTDWSNSEPLWIGLAVGSLAAYVILSIWRHFHGKRVYCSLCRGPVFHSQRSAKHRDATKIPGLGYRSSIVLSLFFTGRYNCMYCGTPFRLKK